MICKLCGNNKFEKRRILNPQNKIEEFNYYFCSKCKVGYLFDIPTADLSKNYDSDYNEYQDATEVSILSNFLEKFYYPRDSYIKNYAKKFNSILDIGCGNGSFLKSVASFFSKYYGSEFNDSAFKKAKEKIKDLVNAGELLENVTEKIDVITMWHVLEHIPDPINFLNKIKKVMSSDSTLIIEVPNSNSLNYRIFKSEYNWVSLPEHIFYYNKESLMFLLESQGFEIINFTSPRMFPLLFSKHIKSNLFKTIFIPISLFLFFVGSLFNASESIRVACKLK